MLKIEESIWCDGCGVEITWAPYIKGKLRYCCLECLAEQSCCCGERMEMEDERRGTILSLVETLGSNWG